MPLKMLWENVFFKMNVKIFLNFICFLLLQITALQLMTAQGSFVDYTENTELIQQRAGYNIKLQCNVNGIVDAKKMQSVKIHWYFKKCNKSAKNPNNCHDAHNTGEDDENDWTMLPCKENICQSDLMLRNVTEKYSGLYKCIVYPHQLESAEPTLDIQLVRTYQLDIKNTSLSIPQFVDTYPVNKSASIGMQVVFQCRVHSEVHPAIKWFRRVPLLRGMEHAIASEHVSDAHISYKGHVYELLSTAGEKLIRDEIYLSKLILNGVSLQDEGFYACVAISFWGHKVREAYLQVYDSNEQEYWSDYDGSDEMPATNPKEFWLLFLIPVGLAMFPLTFWLFYVYYRNSKGKRAKVQHCDEAEQWNAAS